MTKMLCNQLKTENEWYYSLIILLLDLPKNFTIAIPPKSLNDTNSGDDEFKNMFEDKKKGNVKNKRIGCKSKW